MGSVTSTAHGDGEAALSYRISARNIAVVSLSKGASETRERIFLPKKLLKGWLCTSAQDEQSTTGGGTTFEPGKPEI